MGKLEFATARMKRVVQLQRRRQRLAWALLERFNRNSLGIGQAVYDRLGVSLTPADVRGEKCL